MSRRSRREILHGAGLGAAVALAGCGGLAGDATAPETEVTAPESVSSPDYVRPCDERISGPFELDESDVVVWPLTFANVLKYMPEEEITQGGESVKARVVVDPGTVVTLAVPEADGEHVALDYNWNDWYGDGAPLDDAQRSVRFEASGSEKPRQYNGGVVVTGPRCVTLDVWVEGEDAPREAVLPVGTEC